MTDGPRAARAHAAWAAFLAGCTRRSGAELLVREPPLVQASPAAVWPLSQAIGAAMSLSDLEGADLEVGPGHDVVADVAGLLAGLERHRRGEAYLAYPHERHRYYDDNAWLGLDFVQWHAQRGDGRALDAARRIFAFLAHGEHREGGVHWCEGRRQPRNTCATAPAMQLALRLHAVTGDAALVGFASRCDAFLRDRLESPGGLMWDHVDASGQVETTVWAYNQGTAANARVLLGAATGDPHHAQRAAALTDATLDHFEADDGWWRQPAVFNAVCMRNLLSAAALSDRIDGPRVRATVAAYLDRVWAEARDEDSGLFVGGGLGRYDEGCIDQAALSQLYAVAAWPAERVAIVA